MSGKDESDETLLEGFDLGSLTSPREATLRFIQVLRSDPATRKFLDKTTGESPARPALSPRRSKSAEIAEKHRLHVQTVRKRLHAAGVDTQLRSRALDSTDLQEAQELLDSGLSSREAAKKFGVAHTTLLRSLSRYDKV